MDKIKSIGLLLASTILLFVACKNKPTPKPEGYFRIDFPQKNYSEYKSNPIFCFEYPNYAIVTPDNTPLAEKNWLNIEIKKHKAKIHLSYKPVKNNLYKLTEDSRELVYKHSIKAMSIKEQVFLNPKHKVYGTIYRIKGNAASPIQFHLTDSTNNFIRGSFYISEVPNYDSLQPVIQFIEKDILQFIETFRWK